MFLFLPSSPPSCAAAQDAGCSGLAKGMKWMRCTANVLPRRVSVLTPHCVQGEMHGRKGGSAHVHPCVDPNLPPFVLQPSVMVACTYPMHIRSAGQSLSPRITTPHPCTTPRCLAACQATPLPCLTCSSSQSTPVSSTSTRLAAMGTPALRRMRPAGSSCKQRENVNRSCTRGEEGAGKHTRVFSLDVARGDDEQSTSVERTRPCMHPASRHGRDLAQGPSQATPGNCRLQAVPNRLHACRALLRRTLLEPGPCSPAGSRATWYRSLWPGPGMKTRG